MLKHFWQKRYSATHPRITSKLRTSHRLKCWKYIFLMIFRPRFHPVLSQKKKVLKKNHQPAEFPRFAELQIAPGLDPGPRETINIWRWHKLPKSRSQNLLLGTFRLRGVMPESNRVRTLSRKGRVVLSNWGEIHAIIYQARRPIDMVASGSCSDQLWSLIWIHAIVHSIVWKTCFMYLFGCLGLGPNSGVHTKLGGSIPKKIRLQFWTTLKI